MLDRPHEIQPLPPEAIRRLTRRLDAMERAERRNRRVRTSVLPLFAALLLLVVVLLR